MHWRDIENFRKNRPLILLDANYKIFKFERFPISLGIPPVNLLWLRYNSSRLDKLPMACGMPPVNWLKDNDSTRSSLQCDKLEGISPSRLFASRYKILKEEMLNNNWGISPTTQLKWMGWKNNNALLISLKAWGKVRE